MSGPGLQTGEGRLPERARTRAQQGSTGTDAAWFFDALIFRGALVFHHVAAPEDGRAPYFENRP